MTVTESGTAAPAELHPVAAPIASCSRLSHITDCWKVRPARVRARQVRRRAEPVGEPCRPKLLVPVVDADAGRVLAQVVDHVADVVQQGGDDQRRRLPVRLGLGGGLQRVLELVDAGQAVTARRPAVVDPEEFVA